MIYMANLSITTVIILNLLTLLGFIFGKIMLKNQHKHEIISTYTIYLAVIFGLYLIFLIIFAITAFILGYINFGLLFLVFFILPFVIGRVSRYEKANFYTNIQIMVLIISLLICNSAHKVIDSRITTQITPVPYNQGIGK